jgi:hypothetical protein
VLSLGLTLTSGLLLQFLFHRGHLGTQPLDEIVLAFVANAVGNGFDLLEDLIEGSGKISGPVRVRYHVAVLLGRDKNSAEGAVTGKGRALLQLMLLGVSTKRKIAKGKRKEKERKKKGKRPKSHRPMR